MKTIKAIRRGVEAALAKPSPRKYEAAGKVIVCSHCGGKKFSPYHLTKSATDGMLHDQHALECAACSHLELFAKEPAEIENAG
jgi:hypothetical protein